MEEKFDHTTNERVKDWDLERVAKWVVQGLSAQMGDHALRSALITLRGNLAEAVDDRIHSDMIPKINAMSPGDWEVTRTPEGPGWQTITIWSEPRPLRGIRDRLGAE